MRIEPAGSPERVRYCDDPIEGSIKILLSGDGQGCQLRRQRTIMPLDQAQRGI
ncbi:MAG TPA: hypothetical protein VIM30_12650 [Candidatus Limnocylindrales bacterium]|jgi:hypothetical protein